MLVYLWATFCVALASGYSVVDSDFIFQDGEPDELYWPERYHVKASKLSLTSNLIETYEAWRNNQSSRIDYNGGSVKSIVRLEDLEDKEDGSKYEIHPETVDGEESKVVCQSMSEERFELELDSILPPIEENDSFENAGNETILERETVKFESVSFEEQTKEVRKTIWAEYALYDGDSIWIPVRYEKKIYSVTLGSLLTHEIVEYSDFEVDYFDEDEVFDVDEYDCTGPEAKKHSADSDKVVKELLFINPDNKKHVDHVFNKFTTAFARKYAHQEEHIMRKAIFNENMRMVATVNRQNAGYKLAINQFSDRTPQELQRSRGLKMRETGKKGNVAFPYDQDKLKEIVDDLPKDYDLRLYDLITPVKNQEDCGSCWTFGTTSAVEGALARVNGGRLLSLSNQALVDCVWPYGAAGCDGGSDNAAYDWMMDYGLPTEEEYGSYKNKDDFCRIANMTKLYPIRGYTDVTPFSNEATKVAVVNHGPLSVSVHVTSQFSHYSSGIYYQKNCDPLALNHEVTMVGYGERDGELFWILKNSWGPNWGIDGYMLIAAKDNTCGTTTEPTYVVF